MRLDKSRPATSAATPAPTIAGMFSVPARRPPHWNAAVENTVPIAARRLR